MREVNVPLLRKAVEWVEEQVMLPEHEREWDQSIWCGTRVCVAGWVALHEGWSRSDHNSSGVVKDGRYLPVADVAMEALGLNDVEADALFIDTIIGNGPDNLETDAVRTAQEVRRVAEEIAGEPL